MKSGVREDHIIEIDLENTSSKPLQNPITLLSHIKSRIKKDGRWTVILPIHEAFKTNESAFEAETVVESVEKTGMKTADAIIAIIEGNPLISHDALAEQLGRARSSIIEKIAKLKSSGRLRRIGPDKGGHWEVVKP